MPSYYAEGYISDQGGALLKNVSVQLVVNATGQKLLTPFMTTDGSYSAWTDQSPYEISVLFKKQGYADQKVQISTLMENGNVTMIPGSSMASIPGWYILLIASVAFIYMKKRKKIGKLATSDLLPIFILAGGVIAFSLIKKILEGLGLWDSRDTKDLDTASTDPGSWWNPNFWKTKPANVPYTNPITNTTARTMAATIYNAMGPLNDDEDAVISVFKTLPSRAAGSFLSEIFASDFSQDMLTFLRGGSWPQDRLSDSDVNEINRYVNNLPKY